MPIAIGSLPTRSTETLNFFAFYRALQAYEAAMRPNDTRMVLRSDSEFLRYFRDPSGKPRPTDNK